jgi:acetyl-CoA carboxylase carboxyl transferase subunit alpha
MEYLDFELPIKELMEQYQTCSLVGEESGVDMKLACSQIEDKIIEKRKKSTEILHLGKEYNYLVIQTDLIH